MKASRQHTSTSRPTSQRKSGLWQSWLRSKEQFRDSNLPILCWSFSTRSDHRIMWSRKRCRHRRTPAQRDYSALSGTPHNRGKMGHLDYAGLIRWPEKPIIRQLGLRSIVGGALAMMCSAGESACKRGSATEPWAFTNVIPNNLPVCYPSKQLRNKG